MGGCDGRGVGWDVGLRQSVAWKAVHVVEVAVQTREPQHANGVDEAHALQVPAIMSAGPRTLLQLFERVAVDPALNWFVPHVEYTFTDAKASTQPSL